MEELKGFFCQHHLCFGHISSSQLVLSQFKVRADYEGSFKLIYGISEDYGF